VSKGDQVNAAAQSRQIRIERKVSTPDAHGGEATSYALRVTAWAQVMHLRGREALLAAQMVPAADIEFRIRWRTDVVETDRVVYGGQAYDIQYLAEMGRQRRLRILAKLPGDQGNA
jgi:SPP1 family predicted phage head-tail adaptor